MITFIYWTKMKSRVKILILSKQWMLNLETKKYKLTQVYMNNYYY